ncbi:gag-Pol polyprotein [Rhodotorula toruloides]|uniref:Gag-Pol polyprotein n=1 Tax=Rhodotorula toruloides TaxID=5286 RepID=A0A511KM27_RHOTO|nr:gag-Pol polyprotein [Rhodotorula toruloides]
MLWVEPLAHKSDVMDAFVRFKAAVENESGRRIARFRSDNGGEYTSRVFNDLLAKHGIARESPPPYSPQSNRALESRAPSTPAASPAATPHAPARHGLDHMSPVTPAPWCPVFERASAPTPVPQPPATPNSPDPIDFLSNPFSVTFAEVSALIAASSDELAAADDAFSLPSSDPRNHREAMPDSDAERWRAGEADEFFSLRDDFKVFHLVEQSNVPADAKSLGASRSDPSSTSATPSRPSPSSPPFASCLPSPLVKKMHVHQADVNKAYSHGSLTEELYMRVPESINGNNYGGKVLKLDRALYGLKQAGRVWNHRIDATLTRLGYSQTASDTCIYSLREGGVYHYIALYVDDLLFVSPSLEEIARIKGGLKEEYGIKDLSVAKFILGIQIHHCPDGSLFLSQRAYLEDVLLCLGHADCRTAPTPTVPNQQLLPAPPDHTPSPEFRRRYLLAISSLMYAMLGTRVDLAHVVGVLGRHTARPDNSHWVAVARRTVLSAMRGQATGTGDVGRL